MISTIWSALRYSMPNKELEMNSLSLQSAVHVCLGLWSVFAFWLGLGLEFSLIRIRWYSHVNLLNFPPTYKRQAKYGWLLWPKS